MTIEEARRRIESPCSSFGDIGEALRDCIKLGCSSEVYETILDTASRKLLGLQTEVDRIREGLSQCKTIDDIVFYISDKDFYKYYRKGIPFARMVVNRLEEVFMEELTFGEVIKRLWRGK